MKDRYKINVLISDDLRQDLLKSIRYRARQRDWATLSLSDASLENYFWLTDMYRILHIAVGIILSQAKLIVLLQNFSNVELV